MRSRLLSGTSCGTLCGLCGGSESLSELAIISAPSEMLRLLRNLFYWVSLGDHSYRFLFQPGPPDEVVVIDCKTTGLNPRRDEVIAIAAIKIRGRRILTSEAY